MMTDTSGVLPIQDLQQLIDDDVIRADPPLEADQLQPNSLDLRVGPVAYRARYSFLPVDAAVRTQLDDDLTLSQLDLGGPGGAILETGKVYIIPLIERLALPAALSANANPKSSTGRLDMLTRLLIDRGNMFDAVPPGYHGELFLEVVPRAFPIRIRAGDRLAQLRITRGGLTALSDDELRREIDRCGLVRSDDGLPLPSDKLAIDDGVFLTVYVQGKGDETIGFRARKTTPVVDLQRTDHPRRHYWHYIAAPTRRSDRLILQPDEFYIFSSRQRVVIPPHLCAEMVPYDAKSGELRTHYAGFFDSGFGMAAKPTSQHSTAQQPAAQQPRSDGPTSGASEATTAEDAHPLGARVVLEVRNLDVPFLLQDGQRLFRLRYFRNAAIPRSLYGVDLASNYQGQGLRLSKHFGRREAGTPDRQLDLW